VPCAGREQRSPRGRRARMPARRQPAADDLGIARLQSFLSDRAGRTGWSAADAACIPGMPERVLRCFRRAFRGCGADGRTGVRRLRSRRRQLGLLAGGRWFRPGRDSGQHCVAALSRSFQIAAVVAPQPVHGSVLLLRMSRKQGWPRRGAAAALLRSFSLLLCAVVGQVRAGAPVAGIPSGGIARLDLRQPGGDAETGNLRSIYENGVILASAPDENAAEEAVHYALLEHPAPRRLLMIGGGVNGSIAQALKHPTVERIDYVELDPALIGMARQFFPAQSAPVASDPRVHMHYADGPELSEDGGDTFDVIILNVPDPQTAQLNRFYTAEFFRSARDHLAPGGLLALQLRSSEDYHQPRPGGVPALHSAHPADSLSLTLSPSPAKRSTSSPPRPDVLTDNPQTLMARLQERNLQTQYVREYFIPSA
jgi:spermidine synthase